MKDKTNFLWLSMLLLTAMLFTLPLKAQVTIGSTDFPRATLDVRAFKTDGTTAEGVIVPRLTKAQINAKQAQYGVPQTGATVYVTDFSAPSVTNYSDQIGCIGFAYWNGVQWIMDCGAVLTYVNIATQPKPFTFYERGLETAAALTVGASGSSALTYQWRKITGNNIHVRISEPCTATDGTGFNTASFTPNVIKGTTNNAVNTGFYRYFVRVTNATGDVIDSNLAEVAVGCGAKDLNGEWLSFMCFNLGATRQTISAQQTSIITFSVANTVDGIHTMVADEGNTYGDLFQWGRIADGHEKRSAIAAGSTGGGDGDNQVAWNVTTPPTYELGNILGTSQRYPWLQVSRTDATYYGKFIRTLVGNEHNWYVGTASNSDQLWRDNAFAPNDPCQKVTAAGTFPSGSATGAGTWYPDASSSSAGGSSGTGWRIPSQFEWASLFRGGTVTANRTLALANTWDWYQLSSSATEGAKGYAIKPDGATTTLFLPANGTRSPTNALLYNQGASGYYWSGSIAGVNAYGLTLTSNTVYPGTVSSRGYGFALRCIKN